MLMNNRIWGERHFQLEPGMNLHAFSPYQCNDLWSRVLTQLHLYHVILRGVIDVGFPNNGTVAEVRSLIFDEEGSRWSWLWQPEVFRDGVVDILRCDVLRMEWNDHQDNANDVQEQPKDMNIGILKSKTSNMHKKMLGNDFNKSWFIYKRFNALSYGQHVLSF